MTGFAKFPYDIEDLGEYRYRKEYIDEDVTNRLQGPGSLSTKTRRDFPKSRCSSLNTSRQVLQYGQARSARTLY